MEVECESYDDAAAQYAVGTYSRQLRFPKDTMKADRYFPRTSMLTLLRLEHALKRANNSLRMRILHQRYNQ